MSDHELSYSDALAEVQRLLATPRTPPSIDSPGQLPEQTFPAIGVKALREHCGTPDALLATARARLQEARNAQGPFARPAIEDALGLIALARYWMKAEATSRQPALFSLGWWRGRTSRQPALFSLGWWRGRRV